MCYIIDTFEFLLTVFQYTSSISVRRLFKLKEYIEKHTETIINLSGDSIREVLATHSWILKINKEKTRISNRRTRQVRLFYDKIQQNHILIIPEEIDNIILMFILNYEFEEVFECLKKEASNG